MALTKYSWLEALNLGHENPYVQKIIERSIRSNARQELFDAAGIKVKNDPVTDSLVDEAVTPENTNASADLGGPNVPKRST